MKYIDSEKLIAEIESEIKSSSKRIHPGKNDETSAHYRGEVTALFTIKSFIASLQQEQPESGCSEKPNNLQEQPVLDVNTLREWSMRYAPDIRPAIESTAYHFWNKALNARKEDVK